MSVRKILTEIGNKLAQIPVPECNAESLVAARAVVGGGGVAMKELPVRSESIDENNNETVDDDEPMEVDTTATMPVVINVTEATDDDDDDQDEETHQREMEEAKYMLVVDYADEILEYVHALESEMQVSSEFMRGKRVSVGARARLVDFIIFYHHKRQIMAEVLFKCVQLIDMYIQSKEESFPFDKFDLACATCFTLAVKIESRCYGGAVDATLGMLSTTTLSTKSYTASDVRRCEIDVLKSIGFKCGKLVPIEFLRRLSKCADAHFKEHTLAKFFMEMTLHDWRFSCIKPSILAASALCLSFKYFGRPDKQMSIFEFCDDTDIEMIKKNVRSIARLTSACFKPEYGFKAVFHKYADASYFNANLLKSQSFERFLLKEISG